jgi:pimeloyl-ACP methyl ester carboxylesterase
MSLWGELATTLASELQVIAFDPRGVGWSSDVPWFHSTRAMARDARCLLDTLGVASSHVFGLSLGAMVASWLAVDAPTRVEGLVLASLLPEPAALSHRFKSHACHLLRCFARPGVEVEVGLVDDILSSEFRTKHPGRTLEIEARLRATPSKRRNLLLSALAAAFHTGEAELVWVPNRTLLLFGELDPIVGLASRAELMRDLPQAELAMFPRAGHDLSLERPRELGETVLKFLAH